MMAPGAAEPAPAASALERTTAAGAFGHMAGHLDGRACPGAKCGTQKQRELAQQSAAEQESSELESESDEEGDDSISHSGDGREHAEEVESESGESN